MTIMASPDVNDQFASERLAQFEAARQANEAFDSRIAEGKLNPIGGGLYRVTDPDSWDNGEILRRQNDGQILPQHGLDETAGRVALYSATPAWHSLGNIVPGGTSSIDEVLDLGGIGFRVNRVPVLFQPEPGSSAIMLPDQFVNVRDDTLAGLGVVGKRYEIIQNRQAFEFLQDLVDDYGVTWESAGALREGRKVFVSMRLPEAVTIDAQGVNDEIVPFIVAINSHDGSSLFQVVVTPWRPVCGNTERFAVRDAHTRWGVRHTKNATERIEEARRTLKLSVRYFDRFIEEEEALARTELTLSEFAQVVEDLWPTPDETAPARTKNSHADRVGVLDELWATNTTSLGPRPTQPSVPSPSTPTGRPGCARPAACAAKISQPVPPPSWKAPPTSSRTRPTGGC